MDENFIMFFYTKTLAEVFHMKLTQRLLYNSYGSTSR